MLVIAIMVFEIVVPKRLQLLRAQRTSKEMYTWRINRQSREWLEVLMRCDLPSAM